MDGLIILYMLFFPLVQFQISVTPVLGPSWPLQSGLALGTSLKWTSLRSLYGDHCDEIVLSLYHEAGGCVLPPPHHRACDLCLPLVIHTLWLPWLSSHYSGFWGPSPEVITGMENKEAMEGLHQGGVGSLICASICCVGIWMKRGIQDLSFQFRSLREWVSFAVVGRLLEEQEERKRSWGGPSLFVPSLSGPCSKGGVWMRKKQTMESGGHSSESWICLVFTSHSLYIP